MATNGGLASLPQCNTGGEGYGYDRANPDETTAMSLPAQPPAILPAFSAVAR